METTVYNPQKGRLETVEVEFTTGNTTWFSQCRNAGDISMITDLAGDMLISEVGFTYPLRVPDTSRAHIGYDRKKARQLRRQYE